MSGGEAICAKFTGHPQEVGELGPHIATDAGDRRAAGEIVVSKALYHFVAKFTLVIEDIVRKSEPICDFASIANVVTGAARTFAAGSRSIVVELKRHTDHFGATLGGKRGNNRTVDSTRHGHDNPTFGSGTRQVEQGCRIGRKVKKGVHDGEALTPRTECGKVYSLIRGKWTLYLFLTVAWLRGGMFEGKSLKAGIELPLNTVGGQDILRPVTWSDLRARLEAARDLRSTIAAHRHEGDASFDSGCARHIAAISDSKAGINLDDLVNGKAIGSIRQPHADGVAGDAPRE